MMSEIPAFSEGGTPSTMEIIVRSVASLSEGVIVIRADRKIIFANAEASSILDTPANDIAGRDLGRLLEMGGYDWGDALETAADQSSGDFIIRGGKRGTIFVSIRRILGADGGVVLTGALTVRTGGVPGAAPGAPCPWPNVSHRQDGALHMPCHCL